MYNVTNHLTLTSALRINLILKLWFTFHFVIMPVFMMVQHTHEQELWTTENVFECSYKCYQHLHHLSFMKVSRWPVHCDQQWRPHPPLVQHPSRGIRATWPRVRRGQRRSSEGGRIGPEDPRGGADLRLLLVPQDGLLPPWNLLVSNQEKRIIYEIIFLKGLVLSIQRGSSVVG